MYGIPPEIAQNFRQNAFLLLLYGGAVLLYSLFIWHFYRFLAKRDIFSMDLKKYEKKRFSVFRKFFSFLFYILRYGIAFPLVSFFWAGVLGAFLFILSSQQPSQIILMSMSIVFATRIGAYYNEEMAREIAKLIPFALLAMFFIFPPALTIEMAEERAAAFPALYGEAVSFLAVIVVGEWLLRIIYTIYTAARYSPEQSG